MFSKFRNMLCHPAFLGMYLMDKGYQVFGWFFGFFLFATLLLAGRDIHTTTVSQEGAASFASGLLSVEAISDATYSDGRLEGTEKSFYLDSYLVYFNIDRYIPDGNGKGLIYVFAEDHAEVYYYKIKLGEMSYSEMSSCDFSFSKIKNGSVDDRVNLNYFIRAVFDSADVNYRVVGFFQDFISMCLWYLVSLAICYVTAFLTNPVIERRIRRKLVVYDSLSYFTIMSFRLLFGWSFLSYVAVAIGIIYTVQTFMRIRRITVRKGNLK